MNLFLKRVRALFRKARRRRKPSRRPDFTTDEGIARHQERGFGHGSGKEYQPWLSARTTPSRATRHIFYYPAHDRGMHGLSATEKKIGVLISADPLVTDVAEQSPLDRDTTRRIAAKLKIDHARFIADVVMTTDFLVTRTCGRVTQVIAIAVKPRGQLSDPRTVAKLDIDREYRRRRSERFVIATEDDVDPTLVRNLSLVRPLLRPGSLADVPALEVTISGEAMAARMHSVPWGELCSDNDARRALKPGTSARIARYMLATRRWLVDLRQPLRPDRPLTPAADYQYLSHFVDRLLKR